MYEVVCKLSNVGSDVRCPICGQGFLVNWVRFSRAEQLRTRHLIQEELSQHHEAGEHPREPFSVFEPFAETEPMTAVEEIEVAELQLA